jgi:hypothetical protein
MRLPWVSLLTVLLAFSASANAGTLLYEPFNYTPGDTLADKVAPNGQKWAAVGTAKAGDDVVAASTNLDVPGLPAAQGNSAFYQGLGESERVGLAATPIHSGTVYYSLAFQIGDIQKLTTPVFIAGLNNFTGTQAAQASTIGSRLYLKAGTAADTYQIGISKNSGVATDIVFDGIDHAYNTTNFVVYSYQIVPGGSTDDVASLWVNPDASTFAASSPPAPTITAPLAGPDLAVTGNATVASFLLRQGFNKVPYVNADELRIGTEWADVTSNTAPVNGGGGESVPLPAGLWAALPVLAALAAVQSRRVRFSGPVIH